RYVHVVIDIEEQHQGSIVEAIGNRRGELQNMVLDGKGRVRLDFIMPARGLIGFRSLFMTLTSGTGILTHIFDPFGPLKEGVNAGRSNGVMVSMMYGKVLGYARFHMQDGCR